MIFFILRRLAQAVPVLWAIATITFFMIRLAPGDPFTDEKRLPPEVYANLNARYGFDRPLIVQYGSEVRNWLRGDLGPSHKLVGHSVNEIIAGAIPVSLELGLYAFFVALLIGVPAGVIAAVKRNRMADHTTMAGAMVGVCLPSFVLGPVLALVFGLWLGWVRPAGWAHWSDRVLPAVTLGLYYAAYIARLARAGMLDVLSQDFIRTARAKGVSEFFVVVRHALRGGLQPVVAFLGPACAGLITGSFVVETIFSVPGLGRFFVNAAFNRDYNLVLGTVLVYGVLIVLFNLVVDIAQAMMDPRIRHAES